MINVNFKYRVTALINYGKQLFVANVSKENETPYITPHLTNDYGLNRMISPFRNMDLTLMGFSQKLFPIRLVDFKLTQFRTTELLAIKQLDFKPVVKPQEQTVNEIFEKFMMDMRIDTSSSFYNEGIALYVEGKYKECLSSFTKSFSYFPSSKSCFNLAQCYHFGIGTTVDLTKAVNYYKMGGRNAKCLYNLAIINIRCSSTSLLTTKLIKYIMMLIEASYLGLTKATEYLYQLNSLGNGVCINKAVTSLKHKSQTGDIYAVTMLEHCQALSFGGLLDNILTPLQFGRLAFSLPY